jgi:hypothetical protein
MAKGLQRLFDEPIALPDGRALRTLRDAGDYITKLPKNVHAAPEWQAAMEALILVATLGGPTMFARIGIMRALTRIHSKARIHRSRPVHSRHSSRGRNRRNNPIPARSTRSRRSPRQR